MAVGLFDWRSPRAHLARYSRVLAPWVTPLELLTVVFLVFGILLLTLEMSLGWAVFGMAAVPAMIAQWYRLELKNVPIDMTQRTIDARTESELLARLPQNPTPKQLAVALMQVTSGVFFEVRFGIGGSFLKEVASDSVEDTRAIFEDALVIADSIDGKVTAGTFILAMVRQLSARETLLGHLQLNEEDLFKEIGRAHV